MSAFFFFQAEDGIRDLTVTGVQTCALPICIPGYWIAALHPFTKPRQLLYPMGWGTLGFGFPAAIGPASASIRTVSVNGDGGFLFACGELATVAQQGLPITIVIVDDGGYRM